MFLLDSVTAFVNRFEFVLGNRHPCRKLVVDSGGKGESAPLVAGEREGSASLSLCLGSAKLFLSRIPIVNGTFKLFLSTAARVGVECCKTMRVESREPLPMRDSESVCHRSSEEKAESTTATGDSHVDLT